MLTHWGRVTHICISNLVIIGSDNGLSPGWCQSIIWTNAGILLIELLGSNKLQWNLNQNSYIFIQEHTFGTVVCEIVAIFRALNMLMTGPAFLFSVCNYVSVFYWSGVLLTKEIAYQNLWQLTKILNPAFGWVTAQLSSRQINTFS